MDQGRGRWPNYKVGFVTLFAASACSSDGTKNLPPPNPGVQTASTGGQTTQIEAGGTVTAAPPPAGGSASSGGVAQGGTTTSGAGGLPNAGAGGAMAGGAGGATGGAGTAGTAGTGGAPPPAIPDLVFGMTGTIQAGAEAMFCMYGQMPTTGKTAVPSAESHYTPGSHHFLVFRSDLKAIPKGGEVAHLCGTTDTTVAVAGASNGLISAESAMGTTGSYYEAQTPDARRDLPPGVAHVFQPGEILVLTAHYLNTTEATIDSHIEFRLHRMDPADVKEEAGTFFLMDGQLNIPPNSVVTATRSCPIGKDLNLGLLWSHMHSRGYSFRAWTDDKTATAQLGGGDVYTQPGPDGWAEPHVQTYPSDPPVTLHAGSKLMIACTYHNMTAKTFTFGQSAATGEMCLLHGMYWPRADAATERCANGVSTSSGPSAIPPGGM